MKEIKEALTICETQCGKFCKLYMEVLRLVVKADLGLLQCVK